MSAAAIFAEALASLRAGEDEDWPASPAMEGWTLSSPEADVILYDELAAMLARQYASDNLSFDEGDLIANYLWVKMVTRGEGWSHLLAEVYLAFDAGEWISNLGKPATEATDPAIATILARIGQSG